jgi:hypothetical protein
LAADFLLRLSNFGTARDIDDLDGSLASFSCWLTTNCFNEILISLTFTDAEQLERADPIHLIQQIVQASKGTEKSFVKD